MTVQVVCESQPAPWVSSRTAPMLDLCENLIDPFGPQCVPNSNQIWVHLPYCCSFILWVKANLHRHVHIPSFSKHVGLTNCSTAC